MNITLAFLLGLMLSCGSLVAYQYLDTSVKSVEDVEQGLGLNLLSMVPAFSQDTERATVEAFAPVLKFDGSYAGWGLPQSAQGATCCTGDPSGRTR